MEESNPVLRDLGENPRLVRKVSDPRDVRQSLDSGAAAALPRPRAVRAAPAANPQVQAPQQPTRKGGRRKTRRRGTKRKHRK